MRSEEPFPRVPDRMVQQAILQVLEPILDTTFPNSSYGFRPERNAHMALEQARKYVAQEGREFVVDLDLEKLFDRVNHDILMSRIARRIGDKHLLRIIRRFLRAGWMQDGVCIPREEGMQHLCSFVGGGQRVMASITRFLEGKLKLRVNREKSAVAPVGERKFLGHSLLLNGKLGISPKSIKRAQGEDQADYQPESGR